MLNKENIDRVKNTWRQRYGFEAPDEFISDFIRFFEHLSGQSTEEVVEWLVSTKPNKVLVQ